MEMAEDCGLWVKKMTVWLFFIPNPRSVKHGGPQTRSCYRVFVVFWMDGLGDEDKMDCFRC
jgi:hypothetical protein